MEIKKSCFVCKKPISEENSVVNLVVNLKVCLQCKDSYQEKQTEKEYLDSLAEGFVCGCI